MRSQRQLTTGTVQRRKSAVGKIKRHKQSSDAVLAELKHRLSEIYDLNAAESLLSWDEASYMPRGGATARGRQSAMLLRFAHERFVNPALGRLIDLLQP